MVASLFVEAREARLLFVAATSEIAASQPANRRGFTLWPAAAAAADSYRVLRDWREKKLRSRVRAADEIS